MSIQRPFLPAFPATFVVLLLVLAALWTAPVALATESGRPRIGLALGGGGARGIAHIGVLKRLEEMRVPVDCIAGTSMGSIIGGLYASGMSLDQMSATLQDIDWPQIFTDGPPRADLPFRIKQEQRVLLNARVGIKQGRVQLPMGLLEGQNLLLLLEELSLPAASMHDFNQLRIPFRAVATDLATGSPVVLGTGELARAMRASMSIPSILVPVKIDGRLLVDGGVANNVPVDVVRELCHPDVIIAVSVGAPLVGADKLSSVLSITEQLTNILTARNTSQQLSTLGRKDVLIVPDLQDLTSIDFNRAADAVAIGYAAAQTQHLELARLTTAPAVYQSYLASLPPIPQAGRPIIDFIRIEHDTRLSDQVIAGQLHIKPGDRLDPQKLNRDLNAIYGMSDFQRVNYTLLRENGKTGLVVEARQQDIGPDTLKFGMLLGANLKGDSEFSVGAAYTMSALNRLGAQWRNFIQLGGNIALTSDFHQPLNEDQDYYLNPYLKYEQYNLDVFNDPYAASSGFRVYRSEIGLEAGRNLGSWGRLAFGVFYGAGRNDLRLGQPSAYEGNFNAGGYSLRWTVDTLDNLNFPTSGDSVNLVFRDSLTELGADRDFRTLDLNVVHAYTWGQYSVIPRLRLAGKLSGEALGIHDLFLQGGFLNLSGYQSGQLSGQYAALGALLSMYRLDDTSAAFSIPVFAGGSLEVGGAWNDYHEITLGSLIPAGSVFVGVDTLLGPLYLGAGYAEGGNTSLYMQLGKLF
ncbi:MAG: patatin-like phospholipase family protein [Candidatus Competibacteraceae bacterium]|nr:patatin-like phospholipase family protein [Candidatus Competibacteraceae bacterium]MBK7984263.1 patatin-like phospholipase family protein [Candidatus Competibacteraceae bacterium]MBK8896230.1 patatin-like phospholipase family protein [Candidatus Competibacteraceae bacterium]MBK8964960.1 patatin-like phospholipase family protein [Candidatus Competibacteraceae bacterium]MBK9950242.1 patatin-like phospholipase family protein [Candidatus Competibacteraceae bacterium]